MADGAMSKPLQDLVDVFVAAMVVGAVLLGWLNSREPPRRGEDKSVDGSSSDDAEGSHDGHSGGDAH